MIVFTLFLLVVTLMISGMAWSFMRYEATRARLQSTLDRCILMATDLDQTLPPRAVVEDCFTKAGLFDNLTYIEVVESINSRRVTANAAMTIPTIFMHLLGVPTLSAPASGAAMEAVSDIEILLVLDVSGSMADNNRLVNLKSSAIEFVAAMFEGDTEGRVSIGIVPFNGQINLGSVLRQQYRTFDDHGVANVNCVDLPPAAYTTTDLSTTLSMPMTSPADTFSQQVNSSGNVVTGNSFYSHTLNPPRATLPSVNVWCPPYDSNTVVLPTRDQTLLNRRINGLQAMGATSINAGMRWGVELLDPGSRPMFANLASQGHISSAFADRPYDYDRDDTLKVIVLMSDGENFAEERVNADYRSGLSPIFRANDGNYSIYHASQVNRSSSSTICSSKPYYVPHRGEWMIRPWTGNTSNMPSCYTDAAWNATASNATSFSGTTRLTWPAVWSGVRLYWVAYQLYARPLIGSNGTNRVREAERMMNLFRTQTSIADMNTQLQNMCRMARQAGISVYTIAFEAPAGGQTQLQNCAPANQYFRAGSGLDLRAAFRTIAAQINRLRLIE